MKQVVWYLVFAMFVIGIAPKVEASFAPSELVTLSQVDRQTDWDSIQKVLETKMISDRLMQYGLTPEEVNIRLSQLSDQQLHKFAIQVDDLKVGGDGLGIVVAILIIAIIIVLIIQLTGHRVIVQ